MLARTLTVALLAGVLAGAFVSAAQMVWVVPLILEAEVFEVADHSEHTADEATWSPALSLRLVDTFAPVSR